MALNEMNPTPAINIQRNAAPERTAPGALFVMGVDLVLLPRGPGFEQLEHEAADLPGIEVRKVSAVVQATFRNDLVSETGELLDVAVEIVAVGADMDDAFTVAVEELSLDR